MKSIVKNIGKLNQVSEMHEFLCSISSMHFAQYVGERFHSAAKHDLSDEFKQLQQQTDIRKDGTEFIYDACSNYIRSIGIYFGVSRSSHPLLAADCY